MPFHPSPRNGEAFVDALCSGRIGFLHPSAVMSTADIHRCGGFDESYRIAGAYALALRFARQFGGPRIIPDVTAIHDPTGLTSKHKLLHAKEKSHARRESGGTVGSEIIALASAVRTALDLFSETARGKVLDRKLPEFNPANSDIPWPDGYLTALDSWGE